MNDKLKKIIFKKLNTDLSKAEIIVHDDSIWLIDRTNKYWYLVLTNSGKLYWRWEFFSIFFTLFSLEIEEYEPLISEWVESVLNCGVTSRQGSIDDVFKVVESVLKNGITSSRPAKKSLTIVDSVLNNE